ncbi:hypothetical protein HOY82DRAFT_631459 [Tuber indicum]|nr:hypothetical protein HOY82DRAFT_631459 [Tuber indicum]
MGNLCSLSESIREMRVEIGELRNDIARLARDREVLEAQTGDGKATSRGGGSGASSGGSGGGSGGIHHQARAPIRRSWAVGRYGSSEEARAAEEFVARVKRSRNYGRDRS